MTAGSHGQLYSIYYETFLKFTKDRTIFKTGNAFFAHYRDKPNLPFYYSEITDFTVQFLGFHISDLLFLGNPIHENGDTIIWNRHHAYNSMKYGETTAEDDELFSDLTKQYDIELLEAFEREFTNFCLFNESFFSHPMFLNSGNINPFSLASIRYIENQLDDTDHVNVLLKRNDGEELSLLLNRHNLDAVINSFEAIRNRFED